MSGKLVSLEWQMFLCMTLDGVVYRFECKFSIFLAPESRRDCSISSLEPQCCVLSLIHI